MRDAFNMYSLLPRCFVKGIDEDGAALYLTGF